MSKPLPPTNQELLEAIERGLTLEEVSKIYCREPRHLRTRYMDVYIEFQTEKYKKEKTRMKMGFGLSKIRAEVYQDESVFLSSDDKEKFCQSVPEENLVSVWSRMSPTAVLTVADVVPMPDGAMYHKITGNLVVV